MPARPVRIVLVAAAAAAALLSAACGSDTLRHTGTAAATRTSPRPTNSGSTPTPSTATQRKQAALAHVQTIAATQPKRAISVAAVNTRTGASFSAGETSGMWTASSYKLFEIEAMLLQGPLSDYESSQATTAIENSDNEAGYDLFLEVGGRPALAAAARKLGMTHTVPGISDPTFTTTGAPDCLKLLHALVAPGVFSPGTRSFLLGLMRNVEADQRWGVGAAADPGTTVANKNGWLSIDDSNGPGESDDGRWAVTSLGVLTVGGDQVLMAVLTQHQPDFDTGVALVEKLAKTIAPAVSGTA